MRLDRRGRRGRPPGFQICGFISLPPLATAAATSAICSGVASSRSWPIATRARSTGSLAVEQVAVFVSKTPLVVDLVVRAGRSPASR